jgi:hypothetical protein
MWKKGDTHSKDIVMNRLMAQKTLIEVVLMRGKLTYHVVEGEHETYNDAKSIEQ